MTWATVDTVATTTGTATNNLILQDIPFPASNTITMNGTHFFNQPIHMRRDYSFTSFTMAEQIQVESEYDRLVRTDPEYRRHRKPPDPDADWYKWNKRRRKGEKRLLQMMDVCDRLQWFDSKSICLHYPNDGDYKDRILLIHPEGKFEFNTNGTLLNKRNIWISTHEERWSYEDMCLTMLFHFQLFPRRFIYEIGCRDSVYVEEFQTIRKDFQYGYKLRIRAKEREKYRNLCNPFMENRRLPD